MRCDIEIAACRPLPIKRTFLKPLILHDNEGQANAARHVAMQFIPFVDVEGHDFPGRDQKDLPRPDAAVVNQQGIVTHLPPAYSFARDPGISPTHVTLRNMMTASFDTLPDALDVTINRIELHGSL